jgi:hypothetical protein
MKLFRKNMEPHCIYCEKGTQINEQEVACLKCGVVSVEYCCRKFRYDPLKRVPPRPAALDVSGFQEQDFKI